MKTRSSRHPARPRPAPHGPSAVARWGWHYRTLLALRDHLLGSQGERACEWLESTDPSSLHAEDLADDLYDRDLDVALPTDPTVALREVEAALQRIRAGCYGRCAETGKHIPPAQLRARPWARFADLSSPASPD